MGGYCPKAWKNCGKLHFFLLNYFVLLFEDCKNPVFSTWAQTKKKGRTPWICSPRAYMRVCMYAPTRPPYSSLCFLLSQVSQLRCKTHRKKHIFRRLTYDFSSPWKTTCRFPQNNVSFSSKQRVVFFKTTCRFPQNNVSFSSKQRVVFFKTTCRFITKFASFSPCS